MSSPFCRKRQVKELQSWPQAGFGVYKYKKKWYLCKNSQAVKKGCGLQKSQSEKRCEIKGGGQEMAVMVG